MCFARLEDSLFHCSFVFRVFISCEVWCCRLLYRVVFQHVFGFHVLVFGMSKLWFMFESAVVGMVEVKRSGFGFTLGPERFLAIRILL